MEGAASGSKPICSGFINHVDNEGKIKFLSSVKWKTTTMEYLRQETSQENVQSWGIWQKGKATARTTFWWFLTFWQQTTFFYLLKKTLSRRQTSEHRAWSRPSCWGGRRGERGGRRRRRWWWSRTGEPSRGTPGTSPRCQRDDSPRWSERDPPHSGSTATVWNCCYRKLVVKLKPQ